MQKHQLPFTYIETTKDLEAFCARLQENPSALAVDTEFARETTYFSKLSTIQMATKEETVLVDVLSKDLDLTPLKAIFTHPQILKVFHAGRQDLEIFYHLWGCVPTPITDTQILAMVNGFGDSVGYQSLVKSIMGIVLNKECRISNWLQRPLTKDQISYAIGDVLHLLPIYEKLLKQSKERLSWVEEELATLRDENSYAVNEEDAWKRVSITPPLTEKQFTQLKTLAAWREAEAVKRDKPRHHILKDPFLWDIARSGSPQKKLGFLVSHKKVNAQFEQAIAQCLKNIKATLEVPKHLKNPSFSTTNPIVLDMIKVLYKMTALEHHIAPKLLCTVDQLKKLALGEHENLSILKGWRHEIFGTKALALMEGKMSLKIIDGKVHWEA